MRRGRDGRGHGADTRRPEPPDAARRTAKGDGRHLNDDGRDVWRHDELCDAGPRVDGERRVAVVKQDDAHLAAVVVVHNPGADVNAVVHSEARA